VGIQLANAERLALEAQARAWEPPPPVDYLRWAEENIIFTARESPFPGPFNVSLFPHLPEILRALSPDDPCRVVTVEGSAQVGKTVIADIFVGGSMAMDPCDFLVVHPTDDNAGRWSKLKLSPMLKGTAVLAGIFPEKSRDGANSVLLKEHRDGLGAILISGANSPSSLSQVSMRRQVQDDLSKWEMNPAGDPEAQAESRSRAHEFAKIFKSSTPLVLPGCRITKSFEAGSQEYPYVPCPHCQHMQVLEWENMLAALDPEKPEDAHFTCQACGATIEENNRRDILSKLEWRAHNPAAKREHRSFWIWSAYSFLQSFERIAREWLKAKGDPAAEQTFLNDTAGKAFKAASEAPPWEKIRDRAGQSAYVRGNLPAGALIVTIGIDCQHDRIEWQSVAWGREHRRFVVDYGVIPGHISDKICQERLGGLLKQTWPNASGRKIGVDLAAIDGNAWTEDVWDFARKHPSSLLIMVRGLGADSAPLLARVRKERNEKTGKLLKYAKRFFNFGTSVLKMALYRNLAKEDALAQGHIAFPSGLDDEYYRQLTAERRTPEKRHGFIVYRWTKDESQANEALDTMLQAEAAAIKYGIRGLPDAIWAKIEAERETPPLASQPELFDAPLFSQSLPQPAAASSPPGAARPAVAPRGRRSSRSSYMD